MGGWGVAKALVLQPLSYPCGYLFCSLSDLGCITGLLIRSVCTFKTSDLPKGWKTKKPVVECVKEITSKY